MVFIEGKEGEKHGLVKTSCTKWREGSLKPPSSSDFLGQHPSKACLWCFCAQ